VKSGVLTALLLKFVQKFLKIVKKNQKLLSIIEKLKRLNPSKLGLTSVEHFADIVLKRIVSEPKSGFNTVRPRGV